MKVYTSIGRLFAAALSVAACSSDSNNGPPQDPTQAPTQGTGSPEKGDGGDDLAARDAAAKRNDAGPAAKDAATGNHDAAALGKLNTVFTIVMENHDYNEIVGSPNAPYLNSLIAAYGLATNYQDSGTHPSLPNYLMMVSGATQYPGRVDLNPTATPFPVAADNLGTQLTSAGLSWRAYQESMGTDCKLTASGTYAPKHDPFLYFVDMQTGANGLCAKTNVDYMSFEADLAAGSYRYMWITPNLVSDGHNPVTNAVSGLKASDAWAKTEVEKIIASSAFKNGGVIFLTWDEAEGRSGNSKDQVPMIVISPFIRSPGFKSNTAYTHKSYLATVEDILGLPRLATVKNEVNMMEFFQ